jgi:chromosome segregation ATPase
MSMTLEDHERVDALVAAQAREISEASNELANASISLEMMSGLVEAKDRKIAALREALARADGAIQKAAMSLGSTDEWTDQETMIADFEARLAALREDIARLRRELWEACNADPALKGNGEGT